MQIVFFFNKFQELKHLLTCLEVKPNIIAITEVKYKTNINFTVTELNLQCYKTYCNDFTKNSRGILMYVADELESEIIELDSPFNVVVSSSNEDVWTQDFSPMST